MDVVAPVLRHPPGGARDGLFLGAVLRVGLEGMYDGRKFRLTGRTQLAHPAGGVWDEWYAAFADGRWGWLSEAQGRYYLLFEQAASADRPSLDGLVPGADVEPPEARAAIGGTMLMVWLTYFTLMGRKRPARPAAIAP